MKLQILIGCLVCGVAGFAWAKSSDDAILGDLKPGTYIGSLKDAVETGDRSKAGKLTIQRTPDGVLCTFVTEGAVGKAREEWLVQADELLQKEYDKNGRVVASFKGTIAVDRPLGSDEATFTVQCADRTKNVCESGLDARTARTITVHGKELTYTHWGIAKPTDRSNPAAAIIKQRELVVRTQ